MPSPIAPSPDLARPSSPILSPRSCLILIVLIFLAGSVLRVLPIAGFKGIGFDENLYRGYVVQLDHVGVAGFPAMVERYLEVQRSLPSAILPPTRFLYICLGWLWHQTFGVSPIGALHSVSCAFSILTLALAAMTAWRLGGPLIAVGVTALMSVAPTQVHFGQHALIDGFFGFWSLLVVWSLWENLQHPNDWRWQVLYAAAIALMVLTKENAFFVYLAIGGVLALTPWLRLGTVTLRLLLTTVAGALLGGAILINLAGGPKLFIAVYQLLVAKAYTLQYAIATGDGPWYRYLIDLMLVSPVVMLLAIGEAFQLRREKKQELFLGCFVLCSYLIMANVKYGMNLRYANIWEMALCYFAFSQLVTLASRVRRYQGWLLAGFTVALCLVQLRQYLIFFVQHNLYELVSGDLLRALLILK